MSHKKAKTPKSGRVKIKVVQLAHADGLPLPAHQSEHAAGLDLIAAVIMADPIVVPPGARALIPTGLVLQLPHGFEGQVRPRSGLALKHGVTVLNSPGTIDADYRGEVSVLLVNLGTEPFQVARGDRIAQLVIAPVVQTKLKAVLEVAETARGTGGFGSTGQHEKALRKKLEAPPAKRNGKPQKTALTKKSKPVKEANRKLKPDAAKPARTLLSKH